MRRDWILRFAARAYAAAIALSPQRACRRYGQEMRLTFEAACAEAASSWQVLALLLRELADLAAVSFPRQADVHAYEAPFGRGRSEAVGSLSQDFRYAVRMLRRQPAFGAMAVGTLALGIGATTAVFTVVNGVLLRPLPYREPDRIVQLLNGRAGRMSTTLSPLNYVDVVTQSGVFAESAAITPSSRSLTGVGEPQQIDGASVTPGFFRVLGVPAEGGRTLVEADANRGVAAPVVVLGDALWRRAFDARRDVVGSTIRLDGRPWTVVGIAPPELAIPRGAEFWTPLAFTPENLSEGQRGAQWVGAIGRLEPDVTFEQAESAINAVGVRLARESPRTNKDRVMTVIRLHDRVVRGVRPALWMLLGAVTFVLLVACVNVANLLLARASGRAREVAVRVAVGAGRGRLIRQFVIESIVLGVGGGAGGFAVAFWLTRALVAIGPASIPRLDDVGIDWRVLAFTGVVAIGTSLLFGLTPAVAATGQGVARAISTAGRGTLGRGGRTIRSVLVVSELALAVMLLVGAGLLIRSYERLTSVNPGFTSDRVLTFTIGLPEARYQTGTAVSRFVDRYVSALTTSPGALNAAAVFGLPLDDNFTASSSFTKPGETDSGDTPSIGMRIISPGYFRTLGISLKAGRPFDMRDDEQSAEVAIINEEAARRFWPDLNPLGQRIHLSVRLTDTARNGQKTIVGVVGNTRYRGLDTAPLPEVYLPHAQHAVDSMTIAVRTAGDPLVFASTARTALASIDPEMPIAAVRSMDDIVGRSLAERRFTMLLLGTFATAAVLLAAIGVYGVLAYLVSQRTQEIGLRLAIGATPADVVRLFTREGALLAGLGLAMGLAGSAATGRTLTTLMFGVSASDPITLITVAALIAATALCASYVPARRAAMVDPMRALNSE